MNFIVGIIVGGVIYRYFGVRIEEWIRTQFSK